MRKSDFWLAYFLLLVAQLLISNYLSFTPYLMLTILPVMVLCISIRIGTAGAMVIAFATGLAVDWLSDGLLGLNALSLVPVAWLRNFFLKAIFGNELFARKEDFSVRKNGLPQVTLAVMIAQALFLVIYIWADGAGLRPFWFNAARFGISWGAGVILSLLTLNALDAGSNR